MVASKELMSSLGSTGLRQSGGWIYEERLRRLHGKFADLTYREMQDNCAVIGAFMYAIKSLIRQVPWRFEPADDTPQAAEQAEFYDGAVNDMSHTWDDTLTEALTMLVFGYSYHETVLKLRRGPDQKDPRFKSKYSDNKFGWRKLPMRGQESLENWEFDEDGGINGVWQRDSWNPNMSGGSEVFLPIEKCLLFRTESTKGNPEGRSILRNAVRSWWFLKRIQEHEAIGIERDLSGYPVIHVPPQMLTPGASDNEKALLSILEKMVQEIKRDEREGAIFPSEIDPDTGNPTGFKLSLLTTGGRRQIDTSKIIQRYESRILMTVMAEFLMLGMDQVGAFSLASSKTHMFSVALGSIMDSIAEVFNRFAIPRLGRANNVPPELDPTLKHGDIETPDLKELGDFLESLASTGVLGSDTALERKMREVGDLPQEEEHEHE